MTVEAPKTWSVAAKEITDVFAWDDPTVYRWHLFFRRSEDREEARAEVLAALIGTALAPPATMVLLLWLVSKLSARVSLWVAAVLGTFALLDWAGSHVAGLIGRTSTSWRAKAHNRPILAGWALGCLVWVVACPGSPVGAGFSGSETGISGGQWALYFFEHARAVLLLDLPRLFGGRLTSVSPTTPLAVAAALACRFLFAAGVLELAAFGWRRYRSGRTFHATVRGAYVASVDLTGQEGVLRREGRLVEPPGGPRRVVAIDFVAAHHDRASAGGSGKGSTSD